MRGGLSSGVSLTLLVVAAPAEARAVLRGLDADEALADVQWQPHRAGSSHVVLITGVGKANAAGAVGRFADPREHTQIVSLGVAGALPGAKVAIGDSVLGTDSLYGDEGLESEQGFFDCGAMGFPLLPTGEDSFKPDSRLFESLLPLSTHQGPIATISTCSGTEALAEQVRERTGAIAECMEGAAVGQVAARLGIPFAELRIISNTTGQRSRQVWDLQAALSRLTELTGHWPR